MRLTLLPGLAALLLLAPASARAGEGDATTGDPVARAKAVFASMPEPSSKGAFTFEGDVLDQGARVGSASLSIEAVESEGRVLWHTEEWIKAGPSVHAVAWLDRSIDAQRGERTTTKGDETSRVTWKRTPDGFEVSTRRGEGEPVVAQIAAPGGAKISLAGMILFCRALPAEKAVYEASVLDVDPDKGEAEKGVHAARLEVEGVNPWRAGAFKGDAWIVRSTRGARVARLAFDPKTREFLGIEGVSQPFVIVRKGPEIDWAAPAKTAEMAALRAALAFATSDADLLATAVHWPTVYKAAVDEQADDGKMEAEYREAVLATVKAIPPKSTHEVLDPMLSTMSSALETEKLENGHVRVEFPERFRGMKLEVMEVEGVWYLAAFPKQDAGGDEEK